MAQQRHAPPPLPLAETVLERLWFADDDPERTRSEASKSLALEIARLKGLKPFPVVAQRVMAMVQDPEVRVQDIKRALETDPALSARTLQVANSALFSVGKPCQTLEQAVVRLGTRTVHDLMATVALLGMFADVREAGKLIRDHSVGVAAIARTLVRLNGWFSGGHVFLAGLMHDVGKLLLMQTEEMRYDNLSIEDAEVDRVHLHERKILGYDHAVLGAHAMTAWKIGEPIAKAVAYHHQPGRAYAEGGDVALMVAIVRLADRIDRRVATSSEPPTSAEHWLGDLATLDYLRIAPEDVLRGYPEFVTARTDALRTFG
ncbi:MAG TPA: HDOD domain-containing protein [Polyangiaceae bacterium]|nr:HDOD domain-containing protein [Polyangiaceae bacterium]